MKRFAKRFVPFFFSTMFIETTVSKIRFGKWVIYFERNLKLNGNLSEYALIRYIVRFFFRVYIYNNLIKYTCINPCIINFI